MKLDYFIIQCNIKSLLTFRHEKQSDLAKALGVLPRTVNRWVNGVNNEPVKIPLPQLKNIAEHFDISLETLVDPETFANELLFDNGLTYFSDLSALEDYLTAIGVKLDYNDFSKIIDVNIGNDNNLTFGRPEKITITWKNEKEKTISKDVSYSSFETFAKKLKALAMLEIKYIK